MRFGLPEGHVPSKVHGNDLIEKGHIAVRKLLGCWEPWSGCYERVILLPKKGVTHLGQARFCFCLGLHTECALPAAALTGCVIIVSRHVLCTSTVDQMP